MFYRLRFCNVSSISSIHVSCGCCISLLYTFHWEYCVLVSLCSGVNCYFNNNNLVLWFSILKVYPCVCFTGLTIMFVVGPSCAVFLCQINVKTFIGLIWLTVIPDCLSCGCVLERSFRQVMVDTERPFDRKRSQRTLNGAILWGEGTNMRGTHSVVLARWLDLGRCVFLKLFSLWRVHRS